MNDEAIRQSVRERYGERAKAGTSCCGSDRSACGTGTPASRAIGYTEDQLGSVPEGADLGLGCGNPTAIASLQEGETVLDLGSGAGLDCFLAAQAVGLTGRAIGVDMTAEMLDRARQNASKNGIENIEFRLGEIEHLPVADRSVDVVISNCVINLSPDKPQVFREAFRALKPGGRMYVSDIVLLKPLPEAVSSSIDAYVGCVAGATIKDDYLAAIEAAGFRDVEILQGGAIEMAEPQSGEARIYVDGEEVEPSAFGLDEEGVHELRGAITSITVVARKP